MRPSTHGAHSATTPKRTKRTITTARWVKAGGGNGRREGPITAEKDTVSNRVWGRKERKGGGTRTHWKDNGGKHKERSLLYSYWGTRLRHATGAGTNLGAPRDRAWAPGPHTHRRGNGHGTARRHRSRPRDSESVHGKHCRRPIGMPQIWESDGGMGLTIPTVRWPANQQGQRVRHRATERSGWPKERVCTATKAATPAAGGATTTPSISTTTPS